MLATGGSVDKKELKDEYADILVYDYYVLDYSQYSSKGGAYFS